MGSLRVVLCIKNDKLVSTRSGIYREDEMGVKVCVAHAVAELGEVEEVEEVENTMRDTGAAECNRDFKVLGTGHDACVM